MNKPDIGDALDAALYVFRVFQDTLKSAADKLDTNTLRGILPEFHNLFGNTFEQPSLVGVEELKRHLRHAEDAQLKDDLQKRILRQQKRDDAVKRLTLGRDQVIFGLAAWILNKCVTEPEDGNCAAMFREVVQYLPRDLPRLTAVLDSLSDRDSSDYWGWDWWDLKADGQAHFIDVHTKPNRLYCVVALRILGAMSGGAIDQILLPYSRSLAFLAEPSNGQGLVHMLVEIRDNPANWRWLLNNGEIGKIPALLSLLEKSREAEQSAEGEQLIAATLDAEKLREFKRNVLAAVKQFARLRSLLDRFGMFHKIVDNVPRKDVPSWGYNQLDDKGAFIKDWHVSYPGWGEAYGRGLGLTEDQRVFEAMLAGSVATPSVTKLELIPTIENSIREFKIGSPVILQSLDYVLEFQQIRNRESFIPKYRSECPTTHLTGLDGFMGVLRFDGKDIPVFDVFAQGSDVGNKVLIADLSRFARWDQYPPIDEEGDEEFVSDDEVFIRVSDLNADLARRQKILGENPAWLANKPDKESFLRKHVVVNVYEKLDLRILEPKAAVSFQVTKDDSSTSEL